MSDTKEQAITKSVEAQIIDDKKGSIDDTKKMGADYGYADENQIKQFLMGVDGKLKAAKPTAYTFVYPDGATPSFAKDCLGKTLFQVKVAIAPHTKLYIAAGIS